MAGMPWGVPNILHPLVTVGQERAGGQTRPKKVGGTQ
jgi:hypothetical protein